MRHPLPFALAAVPALLILAACTSNAVATVDPVETYVSDPTPSESPAPLTPNEIEADTTLIVRATATAQNGAQLSLELQVHKSTAFDDVAAQTLPAALVEDCGGKLALATFESEKWSFTRGNVTAIPMAGSASDWPADAAIVVLPSASSAYISARGLLSAESGTASCQLEKSLAGAGRGAFAMGIPMDATALGGWAQHRFGFSAPAGVVLSACSVELTPLGTSLGGDQGWVTLNDAQTCSVGAAVERAEY